MSVHSNAARHAWPLAALHAYSLTGLSEMANQISWADESSIGIPTEALMLWSLVESARRPGGFL